ncbi:MAG: hypothetical protein JO035_11750 [Betaproteobacteria bacterium]|nr:hypothetical protein [Betaproteobacteria bacterium]
MGSIRWSLLALLVFAGRLAFAQSWDVQSPQPLSYPDYVVVPVLVPVPVIVPAPVPAPVPVLPPQDDPRSAAQKIEDQSSAAFLERQRALNQPSPAVRLQKKSAP